MRRDASRMRKAVARGLRAAALAGAMSMLLAGCYLPAAQSGLSLGQSVSALAFICGPAVAQGTVTNQASTAVSVRLKVTWLSVTSSALASAEIAVAKVPAHGSANWSAKPNRHAPGALSCETALSDIRAG